MEADFSGWATRAGLKCTDGRTIMPDAFKDQDTIKVPLVWQHGHSDPENVLGHAILENRPEGVYAYGFFNDSKKASHAKDAVVHKDVTMMSIWANQLVEKAGRVFHGAIREVSLVLSGANPGALIENVNIRHGDDDEFTLEDEAIIYTGLSFEHSDSNNGGNMADAGSSDKTVQEIYDSMSDEQKQVLHYMVGEALSQDENSDKTDPSGEGVTHSDLGADATIQDVYDSMNEQQREVMHYMIGEALASAEVQHGNTDNNSLGGNEMRNVFENSDGGSSAPVLSHDDMKGILADATRNGSLKDAVESYALKHGIDDIDVLFPEAANINNTPEFLQRRVEWVASLLGAVNKTPFSRVKTITADITFDEARAKGYVKGNLKKEEFFSVSKRVTQPTTIYKKQQLDRDDVIDITDFDVITWLKGEMRLMLDEEIARAILIGDGRDISDEDKINEQCIRPIASEHELFATTIEINTGDAGSSAQEIIDAVVAARWQYKGTGTPTMFCSETTISKFLLLKDTLGRRIYNSLDEVAQQLRVSSIVPVEAMETAGNGLVAIIVNPVDYNIGANSGGQVSMFDFFDIDYNKQKYLIETRISGALTRLKSALIVRETTVGTDAPVTPAAPTFNKSTGVVTIVATTHVVYKNAETGATLSTGAQTALADGEHLHVEATAASGYFIPNTGKANWTFTYNA